jgi:ribosome-associated protein
MTAARSSGPGGQNVNKVNSKVTLRWNPLRCQSMPDSWRDRFLARQASRINRQGELVLHSDRYRDQARNLADVRRRLVEMLLECQSPPTRRRPTRPTLGSKKRRLENKRQRSDKKQSRSQSWGNE